MAKLIAFIVIGVALGIFLVTKNRPNPVVHEIVGGPCEYMDIKGKATVVSVSDYKYPNGDAFCKGPRFEVELSFKSNDANPVDMTKYGRFGLYMSNGCRPGSAFVNKYEIATGKQFNCVLKIITKGTCTPRIYELEGVEMHDN